MRILTIAGQSELRVLLHRLISREWPQAKIDEIDPRRDATALETVDVSGYNLVLLDDHPGRFDGLSALRKFKQNPGCPPVLMLLAFGDERRAATLIKAGADDYLPKPQINSALLVLAIRENLRGAMLPQARTNVISSRRKTGDSAVGVAIKGYDVIEKIAAGPGSTLYLARSLGRNEKVVLKILFGAFELSDEHEALERFLIEYQSASAIAHPNVVAIHDVGVADDHAYIAMEYIQGGSLRTKLHEVGQFTPAATLQMADEIAAALDAIHSVGILHRDLKPGNVMFRSDGSLCIIDFGLAKQVQIEQDITQPGKIYGTPYYMSPEQGQGLEVDARSDFYSLGVMLFELMSGRKPYVAGTPVALVFKHAYAPIPQLPKNLKKFQCLVDRLMAKNPTDRPDTAKQIHKLLNDCQTL